MSKVDFIKPVRFAPVVRYVNVYQGAVIGEPYETRKQADEGSAPARIACIRVTYTEGQFDE